MSKPNVIFQSITLRNAETVRANLFKLREQTRPDTIRSKREFHLPMFPGYYFACPSYEEETLIRRDKCVWNLKVLSEPEEESLLKDLKIVRECELLSQDHKLIVNPGLYEGQVVRLKRGPFKDQEVMVVRREDASRIVVNLNFLGRNITIPCNADDLDF